MRENTLNPIDIPELRTTFVFNRRPTPVPSDLRPTWRICLIAFLLNNCCREARSSLTRLHVLSWGIRSEASRAELAMAVSGKLAPNSLVVRFEPFLLQAIDFAIGERLLDRDGGNKVVLIDAGARLAEEIQATEGLFIPEKAFVASIGTKVTESLVEKMFGWRDLA